MAWPPFAGVRVSAAVPERALARAGRSVLGYVWASPNTVVGLVAGLMLLCLGGRLRWVAGVAEFHGGLLGRLCASLPGGARFGAMTLGHVIVGVSETDVAALRAHEHVHVRQCERWGPLFIPAYALASVWQAARGRSPYRDNFFEQQAYATEAEGRTKLPRQVPGGEYFPDTPQQPP
jgi:hypothetical protein